MNTYAWPTAQLEVLSIAGYVTRLNRVLATQRGRIKGEVTSVKLSGKAVYFTIKDKDGQAQLDCMIWVSIYQANGVRMKVGDEIIVTGCPDIYAPYGRFCFKATTIEYAGEGALKQAYDKLKSTLAAEGLLAPEHKRPLPGLPTRIGVITSLSGVVIQDFTANLSRHGFKIMTVDSRVEGKDAIHDLLAALRTMEKQDIDVLVIMRGGGSWESLQAFNTESVVRAIADFKVPVLAGIGHDVDVTLAEMVADIGRSTPTAVAEALNEPWDGLASSVAMLQGKTLGRYRAALTQASWSLTDDANELVRCYERRVSEAHEQLSSTSVGISADFSRLARRVRDANSALLRAAGIMKTSIGAKRRYVEQLPVKLHQQSSVAIRIVEHSMEESFKRIARGQANATRAAVQLLPVIERTIALNDPKRNMRLGYSLTYANNKIVRHKADIAIGDTIITQLADGEFTSQVKGIE